jgi:hypothetical protein
MTKSQAEAALEKSIAIIKGCITEEETKVSKFYWEYEMAKGKAAAYRYALYTLEEQKEVKKNAVQVRGTA